jgi:LmbE family N-acetylglucosaminyl deacetylase
MLKLKIPTPHDSSLRILCVGAHSDDIEIGCGGAILRLLDENPDAEVWWIVLGATGQRTDEAFQSAQIFLANAGKKEIILKDYKDGHFPFVGSEIKSFFEDIKNRYSPDLILTHYRQDLHQDHRVVSDLTWNTFRNHWILEYEIVKYDGDFGSPNFFIHLDETTVEKKIHALLDSFQSQKNRSWFTRDSFSAVMRLRGIESNSASKYAEGFYSRKTVY